MEATYLLTSYKYKRLNNANEKISFVLASTENKPSFVDSSIEIELKDTIDLNNKREFNISLWTNGNEITFIKAPGSNPNLYLSDYNPNYAKGLDKYKLYFNIDAIELLLLEQVPTDAKC